LYLSKEHVLIILILMFKNINQKIISTINKLFIDLNLLFINYIKFRKEWIRINEMTYLLIYSKI